MNHPVHFEESAAAVRLSEAGMKKSQRLLLGRVEHESFPQVFQIASHLKFGNARRQHHGEQSDE